MPRLTAEKRRIALLEREKSSRVMLFQQLRALADLAGTFTLQNHFVCGDPALDILIKSVCLRFAEDIRSLQLLIGNVDLKAGKESRKLRGYHEPT